MKEKRVQPIYSDHQSNMMLLGSIPTGTTSYCEANLCEKHILTAHQFFQVLHMNFKGIMTSCKSNMRQDKKDKFNKNFKSDTVYKNKYKI